MAFLCFHLHFYLSTFDCPSNIKRSETVDIIYGWQHICDRNNESLLIHPFQVYVSNRWLSLWTINVFSSHKCSEGCFTLCFVLRTSWHLNFHLYCSFLLRGSASLSMWARQVSRQEMPAGSSSALSTASGLMGSSWTIQQNWTLVRTRSTLSSILGALGVMFQERYM